MPTLQIMSDVHVEFFRTEFHHWLSRLTPVADILVLAGDIDVGAHLAATLAAFAQRWPRVVFVPGNHEYYHSSPKLTTKAIRAATREAANLVWLDNGVAEVEGLTFAGATLWHSEPPDPQVKAWMGDYHAIRNFEPWVYREHQRALALLSKVKADVVVTHHIPTTLGIAEEFRDSPLNHCFCHDMTDMIRERGPRLWVYGHTHTPMSYMVGQTQMVCNPKGYPHERAAGFNPNLVVTVDRVTPDSAPGMP